MEGEIFIGYKEHEDGTYHKEKVSHEGHDAGQPYEADFRVYPAYDIWFFISTVLQYGRYRDRRQIPGRSCIGICGSNGID